MKSMKNRKPILCAFALLCVSLMLASATLVFLTDEGNTDSTSGPDGSDTGDETQNGPVFTYGGLTYQLTDSSTLRIIGCDAGMTSVEIPEKIDLSTISPESFNNGMTDGIAIDDTDHNVGEQPGYEDIFDKTITKPLWDITEVGEGAFKDHRELIKIKLPRIDKIGKSAFEGCTNLEKAEVDDALIIGARAFKDCEWLTRVDMKSAKSIGDEAFKNCHSLFVERMPNVMIIGNSVFEDCIELEFVEMPRAGEVGERAFYSCISLKTIDMPKTTIVGSQAFMDCRELTTVTMKTEVEIGAGAFKNCSKLVSVSASSITDIGDSAFENCKSLTTVTIDKNESKFKIGENAFKGCSKLVSIDLKKARVIGKSAFNDCQIAEADLSSMYRIDSNFFKNTGLTKVTSVKFSAELMLIDANAFEGCSDLTTVTIDPEATYIVGKAAFKGCSKLAEINLGGATTIREEAFMGCSMLEKIDITGATTIGKNAFKGVGKLTDIEFSKNLSAYEDAFDYPLIHKEEMGKPTIYKNAADLAGQSFHREYHSEVMEIVSAW